MNNERKNIEKPQHREKWGGFNATGLITNWSTNSAGTNDAGQIVGGGSDVDFAATSATGPINSTLDTSYAINSLTVTRLPRCRSAAGKT